MTERRGRPPRLHPLVERDLLEHLRKADEKSGGAGRRHDLSLLAAFWNLAAAQAVARKVAAGASQREAVAAVAGEILPRDAGTAKDLDALRDTARRWGKRLTLPGK